LEDKQKSLSKDKSELTKVRDEEEQKYMIAQNERKEKVKVLEEKEK